MRFPASNLCHAQGAPCTLHRFRPKPACCMLRTTCRARRVPEGVDWAAVIKHAMDKYSVELAGGLGPTVGKVGALYRILGCGLLRLWVMGFRLWVLNGYGCLSGSPQAGQAQIKLALLARARFTTEDGSGRGSLRSNTSNTRKQHATRLNTQHVCRCGVWASWE